MKKGKNIHFYPGRKRQPYVFEKMIRGKRISRAFSSLKAAEEFAENFRKTEVEQGQSALVFNSKDRATFDKIKAICGDFDPVEAVLFWKRYCHPEASSAPSVDACFNAFIDWQEKSGRSGEHIRALKMAGKKLSKTFRGKALAELNAQNLLSWLFSFSHLSPRSIRNLWDNTRNFLSWCKSAKRWIPEVPQIDQRLLPLQTHSRVEIWSFEEARYAMRYIEKNFPAYVPYYALRLFAGLRRSEAQKMRWEWIDFEKRTILVPATDEEGNRVCKTGDDWLILPTFLPNQAETVFAWLKHFGGMNPSGPIDTPYANVARKIANNCNWKQNVLRHTFSTMLASFNHDDGKTILATRHTNTQTLKRYYKGVNQTLEDATAFFKILPDDKQLELSGL